MIIGGLFLQFSLALFILNTNIGSKIFQWAQKAVTSVISLSDQGAEFIFGAHFQDHFFAFKVLPTIIFISSLSYVLFYLGWIQKLVQALAWTMKKTMNISGSEGLVTAANIFCGQTEAPLFVKPYLPTMTRSEINTMMTGGMATVAGGVLAAYVGLGVSAGHLLAASIMAAPGAILISKIIYPETEESVTKGSVSIALRAEESNIFEAACIGASEGLKLALNVGAMIIAFIGLTALINLFLFHMGDFLGFTLNLEMILGYVFRPLAFLIGIPWSESATVGKLIGEKMVLNEFLAFIHLVEYKELLSERAFTLATYALCGFANFSSIAIQIGGIGALVPERRSDFAYCGMRAMLGGTLSTCLNATIAGMII